MEAEGPGAPSMSQCPGWPEGLRTLQGSTVGNRPPSPQPPATLAAQCCDPTPLRVAVARPSRALTALCEPVCAGSLCPCHLRVSTNRGISVSDLGPHWGLPPQLQEDPSHRVRAPGPSA